ncbi:MAG: hypothetical protein KGJ01_03335 [Patescibacteria group bacterium]|nr:hypothetical protein [Patescibacteria group bacterium]
MTAQDIINSALRLMGVVVSGESPTSNEMQDALSALNMMLDEWAAQKLLSAALITENFTLTTGTYAYNIGTGQTFNTTKPLQIVTAFIRNAQNNDSFLGIIDYNEWAILPDKATLTGTPLYLYFNPVSSQQTTSLGIINLYPAPDTGNTYTLYIVSQKPFVEFVSLTDNYTFPTAYEKAMKFNLAIELAAEYGASISPEVAMMAEKSLKIIKALNAMTNVTPAQFEFKNPRKYNINSGY